METLTHKFSFCPPILSSVTATLVSLGWTLGFLESICFAILIGISVDFVIHFGHSYSSIQGDVSRGERTKYALVHMGPSVLAAAFTMICSAVIMLFTVITFFQKFALILFFTVIQSVVGSFIVFLSYHIYCNQNAKDIIETHMVQALECFGMNPYTTNSSVTSLFPIVKHIVVVKTCE